MAKTIIIYAHPKTKGHNFEILKTLEKELKSDYEVIDLYSIKYDPVLHENEHYTSGNKYISKQNKDFQEKIKNSENLIFIYPLWWNSMPAILKGFFDKVFTPGFGYKFGKYGIPIPFLKGKKSILFVTQGGPKFFYDLILKNRGVKIVSKDILSFCGIKTRFLTFSKSRGKIDLKKQLKIRKIVRRGLKWLKI